MAIRINFKSPQGVNVTGFTYLGYTETKSPKEVSDRYGIGDSGAILWVHHAGFVDEAIGISVPGRGRHNYAKAMAELKQRGIPTAEVA